MKSNSLIPEIFCGDLRIQVLSDSLIRFERADATGFEDQLTFHVVSRLFAMPAFSVRFIRNSVRVSTRLIEFEIPVSIKHLHEISFRYQRRWFRIENAKTGHADLPEPGNLPDYWVFSDFPRLIPPEFGASAPSAEFDNDLLSGWQISDNSEDFYVFFPAAAGYSQFRRELLDLTGQIPMIPKHALGFIYSRYYPFSDSEIYELVRQYHLRNMPIDIFVVDTDWRSGGSSGYDVSQEYFPDIATFFKIMHDRHVRLMFNDHPEPFDEIALSPLELKLREESLGRLLHLGLDSWWYDRNWKTSLDEPAPGLSKDIWGMRLYHDITEKTRPMQRVLLMANVPGVKNGEKASPSNIATHRYPVWWTGDTTAEWKSLQRGIENAVNEGIYALLPYVSDDIGGHFGRPDNELFSRFIQFGCLSPIFRPHCTSGECRDPWEYGEEIERVMGNYLALRLKLLPYLYNAAREASDFGLPLARRCDLEWPDFKEARNPHQYLLGSEILIAPVISQVRRHARTTHFFAIKEVWIPPGFWHDAWTGKVYQGPARKFLRCHEWVTPILARDGAVIVSQPEIVCSEKQNWQNLVVDVFVPEMKCHRKVNLYEDDGISNAFLEGCFANTEIRLERASDRLDLKIGPIRGDYRPAYQRRSWLLRFHFSRFSRLGSVSLNDVLLLPEDYNFIKSTEKPASLPFICRPGFTGKESGETIEINCDGHSLEEMVKVEILIA